MSARYNRDVGDPKTYGPPRNVSRHISLPVTTFLSYSSPTHVRAFPASEYDPTKPTDGLASANSTILKRQSGKIKSSAQTTLQYLVFGEMRLSAILWFSITPTNSLLVWTRMRLSFFA